MNVSDKVIIVTGGGSGMGRELVLGLLSRGAKVVALDINPSSLEETNTLAKHNKSLITFVLDITDKKTVSELPDKIISHFGVVDGLINNAGIIQPFVKLNELSYEAIERVINVNLFGTLYMTKTFLPHLLACPEAHLVNISSMGGFLPVPGQTIYGAAKAAVKLLTEGLHSELANTNVKVTVVFPGAVSTNIMTNSGLKLPTNASEQSTRKILSADKAAQIIIEGMEQNKYRVLVGSDSKVMDALYRLNPKFAAKFIADKMKDLLT